MGLKRRQFISFLFGIGTGLGLKTFKNLLWGSHNNNGFFEGPAHAVPLIENLGQPCRDKQILAGSLITEQFHEQTWLALTNMNEISNMQIIFIDFIQNTGQIFNCPGGSGAWAFKEVPGNKLVIGTFYDGQFIVFDLEKKEFITSVNVPGESYIWNLAIGSDGRLYGGTYPGAKLVALDLKNYTVENCGAPVLPNLYLRFVSATPDGRILCSFRTQQTTTKLYDPIKKQFESVPKHLDKIHRGVSWNGYFLSTSKVFEGQSLDVVNEYPFPTPLAEHGTWRVDLDLTTETLLVLRQGKRIYSYTKGDEILTLCSDANLHGGRPLAVNKNRTVLGIRGQNYFVVSSINNVNFEKIPVQSNPRPIIFIKADPFNRIWFGSAMGNVIYCLDLINNQISEITDIGRQVKSVCLLNNKIYAASYPGGDITEYDFNQEWDEWYGSNPKSVAKLGPTYIRPTGGIITGVDGLLYSGWMARYGLYGGAVAITNPLNDSSTEILENPLGEQAISGLAVDHRFIYVGTSVRGNGLPLKKGESAKFGLIELHSKKLLFSYTFQKAVQVGAILYETQTDLVAMVVNRKIYLFNPTTKQFVNDLFTRVPAITSGALASVGNGVIYYANQKTIWSLDFRNGQLQKVVDMPLTISNLEIQPDGTGFVICGADLFRVQLI